MSKFSDWRERRVERAAKRRGDFSPSLDAKYFQLYVAFYRRKGKDIPEHGRCDMFHAVIGEMLYRSRRVFAIIGLGLLATALAAVVVMMLVFVPGDMLILGLYIVSFLYFVAGLIIAGESYAQLGIGPKKHKVDIGWIKRSPWIAIPVLGLLTLPGFLVGWLLAAIYLTYYYSVEAVSKVKWLQRAAKWLTSAELFGRARYAWIRPWMILAAVTYLSLHAIPWFYWVTIVIAAIIAVIAVVIGLAMLAQSHKQRAAARVAVHSDSDEDDSLIVAKSANPGWVKRALRWVYDLLALIGTWIKTATWRICPNVRIPDEIRHGA